HPYATIAANGPAGLTLTAAQDDDMTAIVVSGAGGESAGVAGSVVVNVMTNDTTAHIDVHVTIGSLATPSGGVAVAASDPSKILSLAGAIAIGGTAGVGAGVAVEGITKRHKSS